ncbi:MAG: hypothetical protein OFPI_44500 [Osedax symbiont Rs2]|nr:MAG: hypothetical protein OFPI_44500 [Osedax symbiont Rs2]
MTNTSSNFIKARIIIFIGYVMHSWKVPEHNIYSTRLSL